VTASTLRWSFAVAEGPLPLDLDPSWMTPAERLRLRRGNEKRQRQHLQGRLTAKRLVAESYHELFGRPLGLRSFEIAVEPSGAPRVRLDDDLLSPRFSITHSGDPQVSAASLEIRHPQLPAPSLSISHSGDAVFCAVLWGGGVVGADVEQVETRSEAFVRDFFAPEEIAAWDETPTDRRDLVANAVWSAKEAALKALELGLTADTRHVVCQPASFAEADARWRPFTVRLGAPLVVAAGIDELRGAFCAVNGFVLTLAFLDRGEPAAGASVLRPLDVARASAGGIDGQAPAAAP